MGQIRPMKKIKGGGEMIMGPRFKKGKDFFDKDFFDLYERIGYPKQWLQEALTFAPEDSYVISHPSWFYEDLPKIPLCSIYKLFERSYQRGPDKTAVVFLDKAISYKKLYELISRYASLLKKLGVKKGDVVATMLPNSLQHIIAFYAVTKIGAIHTPINVMYKTEEIFYQIQDSKANVIFLLDAFFPRIKPLIDEGFLKHVIVTNIKDWASEDFKVPSSFEQLWNIPKKDIAGTIDFFSTIENLELENESEIVNPKEDIALLLYTSGTTGKPKGVMESHFNLVFNSITHTHAFRVWKGDEINLSIMPMFHTAGYLLHFLPTMYQGGSVIPIPIFDVQNVVDVIDRYKVNVIFAPPTFYIALMSNAEFVTKERLSSLSVTVGCGAPVPIEVQKKWKEITGIDLVNGWGMTETNSGGIISIPKRKENPNSIGVPIYSEVKIVDENGKVVRRNEHGEIYYRGLQVAKGYLNKPEETKDTFLSDGWLKTGDRGYIDEDDFVYFVDRVKDLIIASGYNIAPVEVENVLYSHPAVREAAVIGVPDPYRGETVKAVISLNPGFEDQISEQEIIEFCRERLANFKVPRIVEIRDELPKNAVGKILRRKLREELK